MSPSLQRPIATLVDLSGEKPSISSHSFFYKKTEKGLNTLLIRGEVFSIEGIATSGFTQSQIHLRLIELLEQKDLSAWSLLEGEFTALFISPQKTLGYRSPFSPYLLFYTNKSISDQILPLLDKSFRFSEDYLVRFIADQPSLQFSLPLTPFENVFRLPPHSMLWTEQGSPITVQPLPFRPLKMNDSQVSLEASAFRIRDKLSEILKNHLKKSPSIHCELSGGLDSSFVASFLADLSPSPINAHMFSFRDHPSHTYSENCARRVAQEKGIALTVFDSADFSPPSLEETTPYQNEPVDFFWQGSLFGQLCQKLLPSNSLLFTGFGCDQLFMRNHSIASFLFSQRRYQQAFSQVAAIAKSMNRPALNFFFQFVLNLLPVPTLLRILDFTKDWRLNPFKTDEFNPQLFKFERVDWFKWSRNDSSANVLFSFFHEGELLDQRFFAPHTIHPSLNYLIAPQYVLGPYLEVKEIEYIHPFCDPRMIEIAFENIPFRFIHDFVHPYKNLLREAQKGITPETVRNRPKDEFSFDGYFYKMLAQNRDFLESILEEAISSYPEVIDSSTARTALQSMFFGSNNNSQAKLLRLFSYLIWKKNIHQYFGQELRESS